MSVRLYLRGTIAALLVAGFAATAAAGDRGHNGKLDLALRDRVAHGTPGRERVIISSTPGTRDALRRALAARGAAVVAEQPAIDALTAMVRVEDLEALASDPLVASIAMDAEVRASARTKLSANGHKQVPYSALREQIGLADQPFFGEGIGIAVIDSGIAPLEDFRGRITAFFDFTSTGSPVPAAPHDDYGHGTFVAGLAAGRGTYSGGKYAGVAPGARLIGFKVLDATGAGLTSHVISAITFAVANRALYGIHVINLSLGHPIFQPAADDPLVQAVEYAVSQGLIVVTSAGNYGINPETGEVGYAGITSPGNAPSAITVGALRGKNTVQRTDDLVAAFSSRGPSWYDAFAKPDLVAPGDDVISDIPKGSTLYASYPDMRVSGSRGQYSRLSGTSMSAGVTSGAVAVLLEAARARQACESVTVPPNLVKAVLQYTAIPVPQDTGELVDFLAEGTGALNGGGAVAALSAIDFSMPAGTTWASAVPSPFSTYANQDYAWSQNIVWGGYRVSQTDALWTHNIVWGTNIVWGSALAEFDNIVWGGALADNIVWGTAAATWGDNIVWGSGLLTLAGGDNIVWGTFAGDADNIVWGTLARDNIVWGTLGGDNIVWGTTR